MHIYFSLLQIHDEHKITLQSGLLTNRIVRIHAQVQRSVKSEVFKQNYKIILPMQNSQHRFGIYYGLTLRNALDNVTNHGKRIKRNSAMDIIISTNQLNKHVCMLKYFEFFSHPQQ